MSQDSLDVMIPPDMVVRQSKEQDDDHHREEDIVAVEDPDHPHHHDEKGTAAAPLCVEDFEQHDEEEDDDALSCSCVAGDDEIDIRHREDQGRDLLHNQRRRSPQPPGGNAPSGEGNDSNHDGALLGDEEEEDDDALSCSCVAGDDGVVLDDEQEIANHQNKAGVVEETTERERGNSAGPDPAVAEEKEEGVHLVEEEEDEDAAGPRMDYPYLIQDKGAKPYRLDDSGILLTDRSTEPKPNNVNQQQQQASKSPSNNYWPSYLGVQDDTLKPRSMKEIIREEGLDFDVSEPWQRSMLKEIQKKNRKLAEEAASGQTTSSNTHTTTTTARMLQYGRNLVDAPQIVGIGHTESRDFAVNYPDDLTLITDSSSTVPIRSQAIHRPWIYPGESAGALYTDDDDDEEYSAAAEPCGDKDKQQPAPPSNNDAEPPTTPRPSREQRDVGCSVPTPPTSPLHREAELKQQQQQQQQPRSRNYQHQDSPWLEMEPSDVDDYDDNATVNTAAITSAQAPGEACFCMGYNVLDVMMGPTTSSSAANSKKYRGRRGQPMRIAHTPLGRVDEVPQEDYANASSAAGSSRHQPQHPHNPYQQSVPKSSAGKNNNKHSGTDPHPRLDRKLSRDPDGAYHDQYQYYLQQQS